MPSAVEVTPEKWSQITVLFDDGEYSLISGVYEKGRIQLGERWNGEEGTLGFPNVSGYPVWHVVPKFLDIPILHGLLDELARNPSDNSRQYAARVVAHLERLLAGTEH